MGKFHHTTSGKGKHFLLHQWYLSCYKCGDKSSRRVSTCCSISGTCPVTLVTNAVISHELGKNRFVITTNGTYLWSLVILVRLNRVDGLNHYQNIREWGFLQKCFGSYQHIVEKYSVNCIQITTDGIGYYIFYSKLTCFAIMCYEGLVHSLIF
jgi:hypothetical protein